MPQSATWTIKTVQITYTDPLTLSKEAGTFEAVLPQRVVNTLAGGAKQVFRAGVLASGPLDTSGSDPSLQIDLPVVNDPDNNPPSGFVIKLTVKFDAGGTDHFDLTPLESWPSVTDLADWPVT